MKASLPLTLLLSAAVGGTSAYIVASAASAGSQASGPPTRAAIVEPAAASSDAPGPEARPVTPDTDWQARTNLVQSELLHRLSILEDRVNELAATPSDDLRRPVEVVVPGDPTQVAEQAAAALKSEEGQLLVLDIVEQDRQRREEERRLEREERRRTEIDERATRLAEKLGLSEYDRTQLVDVFTTESAKRDELFASMREGERMDRDEMRSSMRAIRDWKDTELETRFGAETAAAIDEADDRRGFGRRGGRPEGPDGGDGGGGWSGRGRGGR